MGLYEKTDKKLLETLNEAQREELQKIKDQWEEMGRITEAAAFATGFRLAVKLMAASV